MRQNHEIKVVVVDDEASLRRAIVFDLKRRGFAVFEAGGGKEAFEVIQANQIDVVLTDLRMPEGDGIELLEKCKAMGRNVPVLILITGFADITVEEAYDKGAEAVFSKPFNRMELIASVTKATLTKDELWNAKGLERTEASFDIDIQFPELNLTSRGGGVSLGRGGMFVAMGSGLPTVGTKTFFHIEFGGGESTCIEGIGIVRWVRTQGSGGLPTGCGIEFELLSDGCRKRIIELTAPLNIRPFIPKA